MENSRSTIEPLEDELESLVVTLRYSFLIVNLCVNDDSKISWNNHILEWNSNGYFLGYSGLEPSEDEVSCLECICRAAGACNDIFQCAEKSINQEYWSYAGENIAGGDENRDRNSKVNYQKCIKDRICILNTMYHYTNAILQKLNVSTCNFIYLFSYASIYIPIDVSIYPNFLYSISTYLFCYICIFQTMSLSKPIYSYIYMIISMSIYFSSFWYISW